MENLPQKSQDKTQLPCSIPPSVKGIERKILEAKNNKLLLECDQYEFNQIVLRVCALIGCALPSPESAAQLFAWCCDNYMSITAKGFEYAFGLNAAGSMPTKTNHYGSFDASFIGDVLSNYFEMQRKANQQALKTVHEDHAVALLDTPEDNSITRGIYNDHLEQAKKGVYFSAELFGPRMWNWIVKEGIVKDEDIPDTLVSEWRRKAKANVFDEHRLTKTKWELIKQQPTNFEKYQGYIVSEQKRLAYIWFIKSQIK
jgi:hypothetical protein